MTLWTSTDAAKATGGRVTRDWDATGVSIDTRTLKPGDLFVALKAARDGHEFVTQALAAGAAAALVDHVPEGVAQDAPLLVVQDVLGALEDLGRAARARTDAKVVAVTGSVGKTSTKEMLRTVLSGQGRTHAAEASYNNHWGVPLTLARMPQDSEFAVIEIGMNHPGEIAPLAKMARPHAAIVTIVAPAHLAAFESLDGIAREKAAIAQGLEPKGTVILNGDLETTGTLVAQTSDFAANRLLFGETAGCEYQAVQVTIGDAATVVQAQVQDDPVLYKVAAPGRHFGINGLAVLALADVFDLDRATAIADLGQWAPGAGRGERAPVVLDPAQSDMTLELIDDAYNANPASTGAAIEVLAAATVRHNIGRVSKGRRIAVLGDMKELGESEARLHAELALLPATQELDVVHCVGPLMRHLHAALPDEHRGLWFETSAEMAGAIARQLDAGDVVLVKGSLSMGLARVVDVIKKMGEGARTEPGKGDA